MQWTPHYRQRKRKRKEDASTRRETLTVTDNRTGKSYEIPIKHDTIRAMDLRQIKVDASGFRDDELRPGVQQHGVVHQQDHVY